MLFDPPLSPVWPYTNIGGKDYEPGITWDGQLRKFSSNNEEDKFIEELRKSGNNSDVWRTWIPVEDEE
jgi:hypothetical protein